MLDRFAIDFSLCMYCAICVEVCPFDALHWSPKLATPEADIRELHAREGPAARLGPQRAAAARLDEHAEQAKEVAAAEKAAARRR